jgi:hypothetical protein
MENTQNKTKHVEEGDIIEKIISKKMEVDFAISFSSFNVVYVI